MTSIRSGRDRGRQGKILGLVQSGVDQGAELVVDGRNFSLQGYDDGFFVGPHLFDKVTPDMDIYKQEIFGPVLSTVRAQSYDEALKLAMDHEMGNGTAIFTRDGDTARDFASRVNVGMIGINVPIPVPLAYHTFGGWKKSAFGDLNQHGPDAFKFYTGPRPSPRAGLGPERGRRVPLQGDGLTICYKMESPGQSAGAFRLRQTCALIVTSERLHPVPEQPAFDHRPAAHGDPVDVILLGQPGRLRAGPAHDDRATVGHEGRQHVLDRGSAFHHQPVNMAGALLVGQVDRPHVQPDRGLVAAFSDFSCAT